MGRPKLRKENAEDADFTGFLATQEPELHLETSYPTDDDQPIATEEHRIVTKFTRQVPVDATTIGSDSPKSAPQQVVAPVMQSSEPEDEVQAFLDTVSKSSARWEMVVYRLPRYELDNRIDPASRKRVGAMPFTWEYESEIQRRWARPSDANHFLIVMRRDGLFVRNGTLPVFSCEPLPIEERIPSGADQSPQHIVPVAAPYPVAEYQPAPSLKEQFKEVMELVKLTKQLQGDATNPVTTAPPIEPEVALIQMLMRDEGTVNKLSKGLAGKFFGDTNETDPWADVAKEALKSGQAAELLRTGINALFQGIQGFIPQRQQPPPVSQQVMPQPPPAVASPGVTAAASTAMQQPTPAEELLGFVLAQCVRNSPCEAVADGMFTFADQVNETDPLNSVDWYIQAFALMPTDDALKFVNDSIPGSEQVTALPHAKAWTAELQQLLKQNYEGGGGEHDQHQSDTEDVG